MVIYDTFLPSMQATKFNDINLTWPLVLLFGIIFQNLKLQQACEKSLMINITCPVRTVRAGHVTHRAVKRMSVKRMEEEAEEEEDLCYTQGDETYVGETHGPRLRPQFVFSCFFGLFDLTTSSLRFSLIFDSLFISCYFLKKAPSISLLHVLSLWIY